MNYSEPTAYSESFDVLIWNDTLKCSDNDHPQCQTIYWVDPAGEPTQGGESVNKVLTIYPMRVL